MNVNLEPAGFVPERKRVSPREYKKTREQVLAETGATVDRSISPASERSALVQTEKGILEGDSFRIAEYKKWLDEESVPDLMKKWYLRETIRIEKFTTILNEQRAEVEKGIYPNVWDVIEAFEVTDRLISDDVIRARKVFLEFTDELNATDVRSSAAEDGAIAQRIATRFFKDTQYQVNKNSLLEGLADGGPMNCAGRFKAVAATLETIGFDPAKQIFVSETADHIRTILKTDEGQWLIDGKKIIPYVPESGTAEMPLNDYKRELLGLDPEQRVIIGGSVSKKVFGQQKSWFGKILDRLVSEEKHVISNTRRGSYDNLKILDVDNMSRLEHLVPGPVLALMRSQLLTDANSLIERTSGKSVEVAKTLSSWRGTKVAVGGGLAMAMYSACGPIIEKYSEAKSPDEAAAMIHCDISDIRLVLEENIDSVAKVVKIATQKWYQNKPEERGLDQERKENGSSGLASGHESGWTDRVTQKQAPLDQLVMTKEEMYLLFAEQKLSYGLVDLLLEQSDAEGKIDISKPLTIEVGEARVLTPTFFKYFLQQGRARNEAALATGTYRVSPVIEINIRGKFIDEITSTAAWQVAINELDDINYNPQMCVSINGDPLMVPISIDQLDKGETPGSEDWRYGLGGVADSYIISQAQQIAVAMGDTEPGNWKSTENRIHEQDRALYLDNVAAEFKAVPIGFYEYPNGVTRPVFDELEKAQFEEGHGEIFKPIATEEAKYIRENIGK